MRRLLVAAALALSLVPAARAQVSVSIGINVPAYPQLVPIPGYPVYWDPRAPANYFFYDGLFWVFVGDNWYASEWYDGPWRLVLPEYVPVYVLRVPVRYYRHPPPYFRRWPGNAPPHWGEHWGPQWERQRGGWNRWDRHAVPAPAPLPQYQRQYRGDRYPRAIEQQQSIRQNHYGYQPREPVVRQQFREAAPPPQRAPQVQQPQVQQPPHVQRAPQPAPAQAEPHGRGPEHREGRRGGEREERGERGERGDHDRGR